MTSSAAATRLSCAIPVEQKDIITLPMEPRLFNQKVDTNCMTDSLFLFLFFVIVVGMAWQAYVLLVRSSLRSRGFMDCVLLFGQDE